MTTPDDTVAPERQPAYLLRATTDSGAARVIWVGWDKPPGLVFEGTASFLDQLTDPPLAFRSVQFGSKVLQMEARLARLPCVNYLADADLYSRAIAQAAAFVQKLGTPCFNHPVAVHGTTRDAVASKLDGVLGLQVPRTVRVQADTEAQLQAAMEAAGMAFPVIVRVAGDHGGVSTARVMHANDWEALNPLGWGGRPVYLTQFVDYADADGRYRKIRLVVAGNRVFARHRIASADWMIHAKSRVPGSAEEEAAFMQDFDRDTLPLVAPIVRDISNRLNLDYFGIDASLRPDGSLLLFEANACMNALLVQQGSPAWATPCAEQIMIALRALLAEPARWRHRPQAAPQDLNLRPV